MPFSSAQHAWVKENRAAAAYLLVTMERGVRMLRSMEEHGCRLSGGVMRVFEPVLVPEDFDRVTGLMDPGLAKPTVARLRSITRDVLTARYWKWVLLHPELPEDMIHPSRRVFAPTLPTQPSHPPCGVQGTQGEGGGPWWVVACAGEEVVVAHLRHSRCSHGDGCPPPRRPALTGSMGEVPALTASLMDRNDIKVTPPRNWTWTAASPWPPLQQVQACNLWHHAAYADVRARLLRPAAEFRIETGSDFVSVQMVAGGAGIAGGDVLTHGDDAMPEVCARRPPLFCGTRWTSR